MNQPLLNILSPDDVEVVIRRAGEAEVDEMWSYVKRKTEPRWLWHAIDHRSGKVLAYVFGRGCDRSTPKHLRCLFPILSASGHIHLGNGHRFGRQVPLMHGIPHPT